MTLKAVPATTFTMPLTPAAPAWSACQHQQVLYSGSVSRWEDPSFAQMMGWKQAPWSTNQLCSALLIGDLLFVEQIGQGLGKGGKRWGTSRSVPQASKGQAREAGGGEETPLM